MVRRVTVGLILSVVLASCQLLPASDSRYVVGPDVPKRTVPVPAGNFFGLAWLADGTIVVDHTTALHPNIASTQVWRLRADGGSFAQLPLPNDPLCRVTEYVAPTALGDGRLGLLKRCDDRKGAPQNDPADDYAVAYTMQTGEIEVLTPSLDHSPREVSWDPKLQRAIAAESSDIVGSIFEIDRTGTKLLHIPIRDGNRVFWLDDYFRSHPEGDAGVALQGRADGPAWSPDGKTIAFLAEARSIGVSGFDRLDVPYDMYLMSPDTTHLREVMPEVEGPGPTWSPDSRFIVFGHKGGIWLWRIGSNRAVRISSESLSPVAWSPDGRQLAGIRWLHNDNDQYEIVVLDVNRVIGGSP